MSHGNLQNVKCMIDANQRVIYDNHVIRKLSMATVTLQTII